MWVLLPLHTVVCYIHSVRNDDNLLLRVNILVVIIRLLYWKLAMDKTILWYTLMVVDFIVWYHSSNKGMLSGTTAESQ